MRAPVIRILLPLLCAALGLATASCSQSEGPFAPTDTAASPASSHEAASAAMTNSPDSAQAAATQTPAPPSAEPSGTPAAQRASTLISMPVVSAEGSPLGEVTDIIFDSQGQATHVVITDEADGKLTAVPWDTVMAHIANGRLVLDRTNLQGAPSFTPDAWPNLEDPAWSASADAYWHKVARPAVTAHRANPIDSTARLRARPTRDGD
jgi:hypothetical protein